MSETSTVADHCRLFALSDPKEVNFQVRCDHHHDDSCDQCDQLTSALCEIESALITKTDNMLPGVGDELKFTVKNAKANILAWKAHILRSINQDAARVDVLESLDESSVLIVQDWAMKYLPRKYRESQTDWFGKRGIPWHISVAFRKVSDQLQMLTFAHIFQTCSQDSCAVLAVMADVIKQLKTTMPGLNTVSYRQDNAGCYHCGATIICASVLGAKLGVAVKRLDFSDPQGGKGACDRKAATIRAHMLTHLNAGHDIETPAQMCEAILSSGGVQSVSVTLCESIVSSPVGQYKIDGVSALSNIQISKEVIRAWRAYGVGTGRLIPQKFDIPSSGGLPSITVIKAHPSSFSSAVKRRPVSIHSNGSRASAAQVKTDEESTASAEGLFTCPEEGCTKTFLRHSTMMQHLDCGKHQRALEHETLFDKAALEYAEQLEGEATLVPVVSRVSMVAGRSHPQNMGWALKSSGSRRTRFTPAQKSYLTSKFRLAEQTGKKTDPAAVARVMMCAKDSNGSRLFTSEDYLTTNQIAGFFSRLASKKSLAEDEQQTDIEVAVYEANRDELVKEVTHELAPKHPIVYDMYNLCELSLQKKLSDFSITMLKDICIFFEIGTSDVTVRRKKPYINKLQLLCQSCECQKRDIAGNQR